MIRLDVLPPAAELGWGVLFDLAEADLDSWLLVRGQMMQLLAAEHGALNRSGRPTTSM